MKLTGLFGIKVDSDRERWIREYAGTNTSGKLTPVIMEALDLFRAREEITKHIRASIAANLDRYDTPGKFTDAMLSATQIRLWRQALTLVNPDDWIMRETYTALAEWQRHGATPAELARVLETEYMIPRECFTAEPLPFADEPEAMNTVPAPQTAPAEAPKRKATARRKAEATA